MASPLAKLRKVCLALPEAHEVEAWGEPTFRVKNKLFAMYAADSNHHGAGRSSVWIKATKGNQSLMLSAQPDRFFKPPYVGPSGWIGVYLDRSPDWDEVGELLRDGWRMTAPKKLIASSDERSATKNQKSAISGQRSAATKARAPVRKATPRKKR
jgi:hypothetical protein